MRATGTASGWRWTARAANPVGQAGLAELEPPDPEGPSLGYIFDPRWWGRGLATEAAAACVRFGLEGCGKARVLCYVRPENEPSVRVARRLGLALARSEMYKGFEHLVFWTDGGSMGRG